METAFQRVRTSSGMRALRAQCIIAGLLAIMLGCASARSESKPVLGRTCDCEHKPDGSLVTLPEKRGGETSRGIVLYVAQEDDHYKLLMADDSLAGYEDRVAKVTVLVSTTRHSADQFGSELFRRSKLTVIQNVVPPGAPKLTDEQIVYLVHTQLDRDHPEVRRFAALFFPY